jgi:DnaJ-class molecular chaperone
MEDLTLFFQCKTVAEVKATYRSYAAILHPDAGGEAWAFHELQRQYEAARDGRKASTHQEVIETYNRHAAAQGKRKIYMTEEKRFAMENMTLPERNIWRSFNQAFKSLGLPPMNAWEFYDWMNEWKAKVAQRERGWAEHRRRARGQTSPPQSVAEWIALHGGLENALAQCEEF